MNGFEIISKLGEGAYSIVYKVKRLIDNNIYALKKVKLEKLSEKEKQNALNEVRILASVKSNFVISYKEAFFDEKESCLGIVMEYADKGDLYQKISEHKKTSKLFEESDIWRILIQLIKGLRALHELKILHRDLKSANVFLFSDGSAKLGDLNVSKVAKKGLGYTQTGTPYYASPEVWQDKPYDSKSDIWSLGCVLYEMITLKPPFRANSMKGLYNKVIKGNFQRIPDKFSSDLRDIIKALIQLNPKERPSCEKILEMNIIKKRIEYFKAFYGEDISEDQALLQTITIPKNLVFLGDNLPQPNYEKAKKSYNSFSYQSKTKELNLSNQKLTIDSMENFKTVQGVEDNKLPSLNIHLSKKESKSDSELIEKICLDNQKDNQSNQCIQKEINDKKINDAVNQVKSNINVIPRPNSKKNEQRNNNNRNIKEINIIGRQNLANIFKLPVQRYEYVNFKRNKDVIFPAIQNSFDLVQLNRLNINGQQNQYYSPINKGRIKILNKNNSNYKGRVNELYKLYAPFAQPSPIKYPKYYISPSNHLKNNLIINNQFNNLYRVPKNGINKSQQGKKLAPIHQRIINI